MKKVFSLLLLILALSSNVFALEKTFDGQYYAPKAVIDNNHITIGIQPTDLKIHKFKIVQMLNWMSPNTEYVTIEEYKPDFPASLYKRIEYRKGILPNFAILKYMIYVDDNPIIVYEVHTNGNGNIVHSSQRWLRYK
jgi:hypothetical protein